MRFSVKRLLFLFVLVAMGCHAQTTVTGTITDANGNAYANGTASAQIQTVSGQPTAPSVNTTTDSTGMFTMSLPAGSYVFTVCATPVLLNIPTTNPTPKQVCFSNVMPIAISGTSQDVSVALSASAVALGPKASIGGVGFPPGTGIPQVNSGTSWGSTIIVGGGVASALSQTVNTSNGICTGTGGACVAPPPATNAVQYVSTTGNDSNSGTAADDAHAKATVGAAESALPTCTPPPPTAGNSVTAPCGRIWIVTGGTYSIPAGIVINGNYVQIHGNGMDNTILSCTTSPCITISRSGAYWPANGNSSVSSADGGLYDLTVEGNASASQIGLDAIDASGLNIHNVRFLNFSGTSAIGLKTENDSSGYTERQDFNNLAFDNDTTDWVITASSSSDISFGHNSWRGIRGILNNNQTMLVLSGYAGVYSSTLDGVCNTNPPGTNAVTCVSISGSNAAYSGFTNLTIDNGGGVTVTPITGNTSSNWKTWGYGLGNGAPLTAYNYGINIDENPNGNNAAGIAFRTCTSPIACTAHFWEYLDATSGVSFYNGTVNTFQIESSGAYMGLGLPFMMNSSATGNSTQGVIFQLNGTGKYSLYLDNGSGMSLWNGTANTYSFDPGLFTFGNSGAFTEQFDSTALTANRVNKIPDANTVLPQPLTVTSPRASLVTGLESTTGLLDTITQGQCYANSGATITANYTIKGADYGCIADVSGAGITLSFPQAGTAGFTNNYAIMLNNIGSSNVTVSFSVSTISVNGGSSVSSYTLPANAHIYVSSKDNANYEGITQASSAGGAITSWRNGVELTSINNPTFASGSTNNIFLTPFSVPSAVSFSKIYFNIDIVDAAGHYSVGIYGPCAPGVASCTAVCTPSATFSPAATGEMSTTCSQGTVTLSPPASGTSYYLATTGDSFTAKFVGSGNVPAQVCANSSTTATAGLVPATLAIPAASLTSCNHTMPFLLDNY